MSVDYSISKRSQSVTSESDSKTPNTEQKGCHSDLGSPRAKPIKKPKFLTRKQVMFRYMERVETINNKLREMQKLKLKQRMQSQKHSQKKAMVNTIKIKVTSKNSNQIANLAVLNTSRAAQENMIQLLHKFAEAI